MKKAFVVSIVFCLFISGFVSAETISVQGIELDFVTIGNAGNAADSIGYGAVDYNYQIGTYEITASQWSTINTAAGIGDTGYWSGNQPTASISWYEAAQFCNYLTSGNKYSGAYNFDGSGNFLGVDRNSAISTYGTTYVIPTEDEWYKAAYYTGSDYSLYANGQNAIPTADNGWNYYGGDYSSPWNIGNGTQEQNGTYDMMGNVWEWNETAIGSYRSIRGTSCYYHGGDIRSSSPQAYCSPEYEDLYIGFRVASVPEPATLSLLALGGLALLRKRK